MKLDLAQMVTLTSYGNAYLTNQSYTFNTSDGDTRIEKIF